MTLAARLGDPSGHGGAVVMGCPTVMIGGMPAARVGDMHVCPMLTGLVPHVGGPIALGSFTVLVSAMPQARQSDMAVCVGPPDLVAMGAPTVMVGMAGGGGGGGAVGAAAGAAASTGRSPLGEAPVAHRLPDGSWETRLANVVVKGDPWFQAQVIRDLGRIRARRSGGATLASLRRSGRSVTIVDGGSEGSYTASRGGGWRQADGRPGEPADSVVGYRPDRAMLRRAPGDPARDPAGTPRTPDAALERQLSLADDLAHGRATPRRRA